MGGGGAERVTLEIIRALVRRGHQVDLLIAQGGGELIPLLPPQVRIIDLGARRLRNIVRPLARYLRKARPDTLHLLMWPLTVWGIIAHRLSGSRARLVVSDHIAFSNWSVRRAERPLLRWSMRLFYPLADFRTIISSRAADGLAQLTGLPRNSIDVLYNPISPPAEVATNADVERLWGDAGQRILCAGSLKPQKNHKLLLRAFARIRQPGRKLMILGEGPLRPELERLAADLGIGDDLILPGFAVDPWPYYASASLFVLSSDWEGLPLVIPEALYAGLPIVCTDCESGPAELLDGGHYGTLVPCGDEIALAEAIEQALAASNEPASQRARAAEVAGPATVENYVELLLGGGA
jgi:glycosyltransferase involved in cell wall biosynthesis